MNYHTKKDYKNPRFVMIVTVMIGAFLFLILAISADWKVDTLAVLAWVGLWAIFVITSGYMAKSLRDEEMTRESNQMMDEIEEQMRNGTG